MASANSFYPRLTWYYVNRAGDNSTAARRYQQKSISNLVMQFTCQLAEKFILFVLGCAPLAGINAQTTESTSGLQTSLNIFESDPAAGIRSLVDAKQWDRAAELTVALRDVISDQIVPWQSAGSNSPGTITYLSWRRYVNQVTGQLFAANPGFVAAWRKRVRLRVQSLIENDFSDIEQQRKFVERYMFAEGGAQQLVNLSARYAEAGHLQDAIWFLSQLDTRFARFRYSSGETFGRGLSETSITEQELGEAAARLIVMSVLNEPGRYLPEWFDVNMGFGGSSSLGTAEAGGLRSSYVQSFMDHVTWYREQFGTAEGTLGNQSGPLHKLLNDWYLALLQHTTEELRRLDSAFPTDGKSWEIVLPKKSPTFSESSSLTIQIRPVIANATTLIWRDSNRIYAANLKDSKPLFNNGNPNRSSATDPFVVWQNIRESNWPKPVVGFDQHLLSSAEDWAFGVFDQAESNVIVGIDLDKEGRLLPGFPIAPPDSSWQFEGPPVIEDDKLFIVARKFVSGDQQIESHVLCYALRMNEFSAPLTQLWSTKIGQSQLQLVKGISSVDARRLATFRLSIDDGEQADIPLQRSRPDCLFAASLGRSGMAGDLPAFELQQR